VSYRTIPTSGISVFWKCTDEKCEKYGVEVEQPLVDLSTVGCAICAECGADLELQDEVKAEVPW
jgi:hypothetical protein